MGATIINGREIASKMRDEMQKEVDLFAKKGFKPGLAIIVVEGPGSFAGNANVKSLRCEKMGIKCEIFQLSSKSTEDEVVALIDKLNESKDVHGINIHPLPKHFNQQKIYEAIAQEKDIEGLNPINRGNFLTGNESLLPFTPLGILKLIDTTGVKIEGAKAVIIGRSGHVGLPLGFMLLERNATVTWCHSYTKKVSEHTKDADILIVAIGHAGRIPGHIIKPGAVVVDVGVNFVGGFMVGDVEFDTAKEVAGFITPVPRGVGPMTITTMISNLIQAMKMQIKEI